ncbi:MULTISPECIES: PLP-dependent aspartate aminotransferase family protein [unclassified Leclercia]|uniref:PLP-dependent transferase n=1 Tax=Leclercia barmai TaxID=2785629 RepID=A0ABS7RYU7_9ENTR|nr:MULTISPECIES: PLP-dependent aspartate aminotransferase family protein [unclassified Leclercia]MBZ0059460.1 PLP-dependent transferase [Leclercia sp. EMC7]MCM5697405.1 PLP-dependent aspartate aminotransferase family protein [Leclercia sp. LTM01]MCM5702000.1 PLP-dependent aspartate aminotransferase family protein [Leclercia sp. LTM14]
MKTADSENIITGIETALVHLGRESAEITNSVNPPLVRASTTVFRTLSEFKNSYKGVVFESPRYGRSGTSTNFELQAAMARISNAETCIATSSGLSAIAAVISAHASQGSHILVQRNVYGPTKALCDNSLNMIGSRVEYFDNAVDLETMINEATTLIFIEVPASLTMDMIDVRAVCLTAKKRNIPVACDGTWGTPVFFDAHALGVDISIHAATKYINGHSDLMMGLVTGSYDALASTRVWCDRFGSHASADACWLVLRGLRTLAVRMKQHHENAREVANFLCELPAIKKVMFPALPPDPGHSLWKSQFTGAPGPFTVELKNCNETSFELFINSLKLFGLGTSWGGFESLVMPAVPHHLRSLAVLPDEGRLVRLHIGLESPRDLCNDLERALAHL